MTTQLEPPPTQRVACRDCIHFREYLYGSGTVWKRKTGCYHPELMASKQKDDYLAEQEIPGDHEKLNLRGDCEKFEARPPRGSFLQRVLATLLS